MIGCNCNLLPAIPYAASLAHHGILGSVEQLFLCDVDLTSVQADHLASLVSSVTWRVAISNVIGCDLVNILDGVKSLDFGLVIANQSLGSEETRALVRVMESGVTSVEMGDGLTLDIRVLIEYSGQGKCISLICKGDTEDRYREQLRIWATINILIFREWRNSEPENSGNTAKYHAINTQHPIKNSTKLWSEMNLFKYLQFKIILLKYSPPVVIVPDCSLLYTYTFI